MRMKNVNLLNAFKRKNVIVIEEPKWGPRLRKAWEDTFVSHLSTSEKESIYLYDDKDGACGFLWHVFSYERLRCLENKQADEAFNLVEKNHAIFFFNTQTMLIYWRMHKT